MPKQVWFIIIGTFLNTVGNSFLWPLNSIYIHDYLGKSLTIAGIVLMLNSLAGVFGNLVGGRLFDRLGGYKTILIAVLLNLAVIVCLVIWHDWSQYVILLMMIGFSGGIVFPVMYALVGSVWPDGGRRAFNAIFLAHNVGVAIGPAIAGFIADINFEYVFVANLVAYILLFIVIITTFKRFDSNALAPKNATVESTGQQDRVSLLSLLILCVSLACCWLSYSQWSATISSHTQGLGISLSQYSLLWTINGFLIVGVQPFIRPLVKYWEHKVKHQLIFGLVLMAVSFGLVSIAGNLKMFVAAMVILTLGEVFFMPVIPMVANKLAPKGEEGLYQGLVNSASTIGRMLGPLFGGIMVDYYGMQVLAIAIVGILIVAIIPCLLYDSPLKRSKFE